MRSALARTDHAGRRDWLNGVRRPEWVAIAFFVYLFVLAQVRPVSSSSLSLLLLIPPVLIWFLARRASHQAKPWVRVTRDWATLALLLVAYVSLNLFVAPPLQWLPGVLIAWDRALLPLARPVIEFAGPVVPFVLEGTYVLLYAIPPAALGVVYACKASPMAERFLLILLTGTFLAYALIPFFPMVAPRLAFPEEDLPSSQAAPRSVSGYLLSVFSNGLTVMPSGHVAVAFSAAFGLLAVVRGRRAVWVTAFVIAGLVWLATFYGRYHYLADGPPSIALASCAYWLAGTETKDAL